MKDKKKVAAGALIALLILGGVALAKKPPKEKPEEKPKEAPIVGEEAKYIPVMRHPEISPEETYVELGVLPTPEAQIFQSIATKLPLVSPVIDIEETTENREYIEAVEDAEEARLMAMPNGSQCTTTFLDNKGNYYACVNGYAVLTIKAQDPEIEAKKVEIKETGTVTEEPPTWMEKELLEQERTGYTEAERHKMVYNYRQAHPGVSGSEAYKILFGSYLGR